MAMPLPASGTSTAQGGTAWIFSDGKAGHEALTEGVAAELGLDIIQKRVPQKGLWRLAAPFGPVSRDEKSGDGLLRAPWPAIALAAGRTTIPYLRALKARAGRATFTVALMDPRTGLGTADLIWVPEHDRLRGKNVITTLTAPHRFSAERQSRLRANLHGPILNLAKPRIAVLVGGPSKSHAFTDQTTKTLVAGLKILAGRGASFMVTPSRRTPDHVLAAVKEATAYRPRVVWNGSGPNPYADFLAAADAFVVTGDSVNMVGEAASTGRAIFVCHPEGRNAKFQTFHQGLTDAGATRDLADLAHVDHFWDYEPILSAPVIAAEIKQRYATWAASP